MAGKFVGYEACPKCGAQSEVIVDGKTRTLKCTRDVDSWDAKKCQAVTEQKLED